MSATASLRTWSAPARRAIALGTLLLAALLVWLLVVLPIEAIATSQQDWRDETARQIARDRGLVKSGPQLRELLQTVAHAPIRARLYESGGTMTVDDQLQNELRAAMLQAGVEPTTFKVLPGASIDGLRQHRLEFSSIMSVDQLRGLYGYLTQQPHYMRIERLRIEAPPTQRADENPRLTVLMEIQGFTLDATGPAAKVAGAH